MKSNDYDDIGICQIPEKFKYSEVSEHGRPHHEKFDDFYNKHPFMEISKRAKIFSPFDALRGFNEAVSAKEIQYQPKIILDESELDKLNRTLSVLHQLTQNSRIAKHNRIIISVTYFVPCTDINSESYGFRGKYVTLNGICMKVDGTVSKTITVDTSIIPIGDILKINSENEHLKLI